MRTQSPGTTLEAEAVVIAGLRRFSADLLAQAWEAARLSDETPAQPESSRQPSG